MSWTLAVGVGAILIVVITLFTTVMPKFRIMQKLVDRINLVTREILSEYSCDSRVQHRKIRNEAL